jgi:hypothetical protein
MTSGTWIALKDASWVSVIGLICISTFALSYIVTRQARAESRTA